MIAKIQRAATDALLAAQAKLALDEIEQRHQRSPWLADQVEPSPFRDDPGKHQADSGVQSKAVVIDIAPDQPSPPKLPWFLRPQKVKQVLGDIREQQLQELSLDEDVLSKEQKMANHQFNYAVTVALSTVTTAILFPPLLLLHIPFFFLVTIPIYQEAYQDIFKRRRVTTTVVDAAVTLGALVYAPFNPPVLLIGSMFGLVFSWTNRIVARVKRGTRDELTNLMGEQPKTVWLLRDGLEVEVPFETVQVNDLIVIDAGQTIPIDGLIHDGIASVDQHLLTGEAQPAEKGVGDPVFAATMVMAGRIVVQVQQTGEETAAAQIGQMLMDTADFTSSVELRGKEIANRAVLPTLGLAGASLPFIGPSGALAILFSSVGGSMKMVGPLTVLNYLQQMAHQGILIKDGRALEHIRQVDTVVFDKTGTLTLEQPHVCNIHTWDEVDEDTVLYIAAAAEQRQSHPIAKAILYETERRQLTLPAIDDAAYEVGYGIQVTVEEQRIRVGSQRYMVMEAVALPDTVEEIAQHVHAQGHSLVYVALDDRLIGAIELQPTVRPEAQEIIEYLQQRGVETYILSGDHEAPTRTLAAQLGIDHYFAETRPEEKAEQIVRLQEAGKFVCFIGDGINDAIALKQAEISISLRGATTIATDTAHIVMMDQTLTQLPALFAGADAFEGNMQANLATSVVPGVFIIGGAFAGLIGYGASTVIYTMGLGAGVVNAMLPRLAGRREG